MLRVIANQKGKLMFKLLLLLSLVLAFIVTSPRNEPLQQQNQAVQCLPEVMARKLAEDTTLPEYPEEPEPGTSQGVVFAAALFGTDGKLSGIRIYETPNEQFSDAVKAAMQKWKLKEFFNGAQEPIMTRTGIRFHFVFDGANGRVDLATEQEQNEFGGEWGKRVCRGSFDE
jgi:outer membrane biosynthesis protein TonB